MRRFGNAYKRIEKLWRSLTQVERYIWLSVGLFLLGWAVAQNSKLSISVWSVVASLGTLAAAVAALSTAYTTRNILENQLSNDREEKQPNLILSKPLMDVSLQNGDDELGEYLGPYVSITFEASNISQHSINIFQVVFTSPARTEKGGSFPVRALASKLIPPGETQHVEASEKLYFFTGDSGAATVYFYYGAAGQRAHALTWRFRNVEELETARFTLSGDDFSTKQFYLSPEIAEQQYWDLLKKEITFAEKI